jgi:hypothetical protein
LLPVDISSHRRERKRRTLRAEQRQPLSHPLHVPIWHFLRSRPPLSDSWTARVSFMRPLTLHSLLLADVVLFSTAPVSSIASPIIAPAPVPSRKRASAGSRMTSSSRDPVISCFVALSSVTVLSSVPLCPSMPMSLAMGYALLIC